MDQKARKILHRYYWKNGWLKENERFITEEDYNYACEKGMMFELAPQQIEHDDCICKIKNLLNKYSKQNVVDLFVASLSTREVYYRSLLSSYIQAEKLSTHKFETDEYYCEKCKNFGLYTGFNIKLDKNVMNFEKSKWGGVRLNYLSYILFDLEQSQEIQMKKPNNDDIQILNDIFKCIDNCKENDTPRKLEKYLKDIIPSSKAERDVIIEIFANIKILEPKKERESLWSDFGDIENWRGIDGYNRHIAKEIFGEYFQI